MNDGWVETTLGEVVEVTKGKKPKEVSIEGNGYPYLIAEVLRGGQVVKRVTNTDGLLTANEHDCLLLWDGAGAGDSFPGRLGVVASTMARVRPKANVGLDSMYLAYAVENLREEIKSSCRGTTVPHVSPDVLRALPILLPPLPVQRRIVDVMTHVDSHLANLRAEKEALTALTSSLRKTKFEELDSEMSPANEIFEMRLGRQKSARQSVGDFVFSYIRAGNISASGLNLNDVQTMNFEPHEQEAYGLLPDDILLVEGGTVGLAARWCGEIEGFVGFDKHVIRLRASQGKSIPEYALQWAHWSKESGAFDRQATGITIQALGFGRASSMLVPDIPIELQEELCSPLSTLESLTADLVREMESLQKMRAVVLSSLLSGADALPKSYDTLLSEVA